MENLLIIKNNDVYIATDILAKELERKHQVITNLIKTYESELKNLGVLTFQKCLPKTKKGGQPSKIYYLNKKQYIFLITNMRTKAKEKSTVMKAKLEIADQFVEMQKKLLQISLQQQNQEWIETRQKGKESRKEFTDVIKELQVLHAKKYPDSTYTKEPNRLYSNITRMIDKALFDIQVDVKNKRNYMTKQQLTYLDVAEIKMQEIIQKCIDENRDAKETYIILQAEIEPYAKFIGKTPIIDMLTNKQISMFEGDSN